MGRCAARSAKAWPFSAGRLNAGMILTAIAQGGDILRINGRYGKEAPLSKSDNASERA